jgi:hypothetical protein
MCKKQQGTILWKNGKTDGISVIEEDSCKEHLQTEVH